MPRNKTLFGFFALMAVLFAGLPASAAPRDAAVSQDSESLAAQTKRRPHVLIRPRRIHPGPNAKRICRSWLVEEYRVSGPVIVPQMRCWWEQ